MATSSERKRQSRYATASEKTPSPEVLKIAELVAFYGFLTSNQIGDYFGYTLNREGKPMVDQHGKPVRSKQIRILRQGKLSGILKATKADHRSVADGERVWGGSPLDIIQL